MSELITSKIEHSQTPPKEVHSPFRWTVGSVEELYTVDVKASDIYKIALVEMGDVGIIFTLVDPNNMKWILTGSKPGLKGDDGEVGLIGPVGPLNKEGPPGLRGLRGKQGPKGDGLPGAKGNRGKDGPPGPVGPGPVYLPGLVGFIGPSGNDGVKGDPGEGVKDASKQPMIDHESFYTREVAVSYNSSAEESYTQVNASSYSKAVKSFSQVNASNNCETHGGNTQINASLECIIYANSSQINASSKSQIGTGPNELLFSSQINSSDNCLIQHNNVQINSSKGVLSNQDNCSIWGYGETATPSISNQTVRIEAETGRIVTKTNISVGGFDYAEYFPNLNKEILPTGSIVTLEGEKVRIADKVDDIILGTVTKTAGVVGNSSELCWSKRYLKDEFGEVITEDVAHRDSDGSILYKKLPVLNPDYDPNQEFIPKSKRPSEHTLVSLLGQVYVKFYSPITAIDLRRNTLYLNALGLRSSVPTRLRIMRITTNFDSKKGYGVALCFIR